MFTIGYVLAIVVVLIPMILSYASTGRFPAVPLRRVILLAAIVPGIVCFEAALRISLEYYWFSELGKTQREHVHAPEAHQLLELGALWIALAVG